MSNDARELYDGIGAPFYGKHFNGSIHAIFGTQGAALAWQRGLGADRRYFWLEDKEGNRVTMRENAHGHAYAIMAKLSEGPGDGTAR